jgi:hypothetical protein
MNQTDANLKKFLHPLFFLISSDGATYYPRDYSSEPPQLLGFTPIILCFSGLNTIKYNSCTLHFITSLFCDTKSCTSTARLHLVTNFYFCLTTFAIQHSLTGVCIFHFLTFIFHFDFFKKKIFNFFNLCILLTFFKSLNKITLWIKPK